MPSRFLYVVKKFQKNVTFTLIGSLIDKQVYEGEGKS